MIEISARRSCSRWSLKGDVSCPLTRFSLSFSAGEFAYMPNLTPGFLPLVNCPILTAYWVIAPRSGCMTALLQ